MSDSVLSCDTREWQTIFRVHGGAASGRDGIVTIIDGGANHIRSSTTAATFPSTFQSATKPTAAAPAAATPSAFTCTHVAARAAALADDSTLPSCQGASPSAPLPSAAARDAATPPPSTSIATIPSAASAAAAAVAAVFAASFAASFAAASAEGVVMVPGPLAGGGATASE